MQSHLTKPLAKYPHIRQVGQLYYLAGQGCRDPQTDECCGLKRDANKKIESYDITAQTDGVFKNIERALKSAGLNKSHLVDVTVFLTDMLDFDKMNAAWNRYFDEGQAPTRTTISVRELPGDNYIEMKAIAANSNIH